MNVIHDHFIVAVDQLYDTPVSKSKIITLNTSYLERWSESHLKHRRVYGTVLATPLTFSDTVIDVDLPGMPEPRIFVSGEFIGLMARAGHRHLPSYSPTTCDGFPTVTLADVAKLVDVKVRDRIYFDYLVTDETNFLGKHGPADMYLCRVDKIYCVVRDGKIIPQGGWCLVRPDFETWEDITLPSGIVTKVAPGATWTRETDNEGRPAGWKMDIEGKPLQGFIEHVSDREDLKAGDHVLFQLDADARIKIEGTEYYVMKESDMLCRI